MAIQFVSHFHSTTQLRMHDNKYVQYYEILNELWEIIAKQNIKNDNLVLHYLHFSTNIVIFYVFGSMHRWSILITVQRNATQTSLFIILKVHSTCFGCQPHPSSVHKTVTTASGTGHIFCAATSLQRVKVVCNVWDYSLVILNSFIRVILAYFNIYIYIYTHARARARAHTHTHTNTHIQGVPGGMCQTSGECSLC